MGKATRKYYRTIILGIAAMGALVWAAVDQFGIPWEDMLDLLLVTLALVSVVIVAAAAVVGLWLGLSRILRKED